MSKRTKQDYALETLFGDSHDPSSPEEELIEYLHECGMNARMDHKVNEISKEFKDLIHASIGEA